VRVCLVSLEYPPETGGGGIGTQTYLKAHGLSARGHEVHVVSISWDGEARTYRDGDAVIHRIPQTYLNVPWYELSTYWLAHSAAVAEKLHALSKQIAFDIIQFPEYSGEGFIYQTDTFRYRTARYVVQLHGPLAMFAEHMGWPERGSTLHRIGCFMEQTVIQHADRLLASSRATAALCAERYGCSLDEIEVIHSGINTAMFRPQPPPDDVWYPKVLFVGNLGDNKGIESLVNAVIALRATYPRICLRVVGKGGQDFVTCLRQRIAADRAQANVEILGYVPYGKLPEQYAWCDFFAGPSVYEPGPGNVYLEAMACEKPVIACNSGGAPEVVLDRSTGLLVPPQDVVALQDAIVTLTEDALLREQLGRNARAWVEWCFSIEQYTTKVERVYQDLVS
jgi:glycosyltransferase involved in cell wall biosynthesis